jgi:hypothetical protein
MPWSAEIVDWSALLQSIGAAALAGLGLTLFFSVAIYGATKTVELARDERPLAAGAALSLMALGLAASVAGIVLGVIVMTSK